VTAGKITAIGCIYAASPEMGAESGRRPGVTLAKAIGERLKKSKLDTILDSIDFGDRFSADLMARVTKAHKYLVTCIAVVTKEWSLAAEDTIWKPRNQTSFASKYRIHPVNDAGLTFSDVVVL
jgi:hypothetical protein